MVMKLEATPSELQLRPVTLREASDFVSRHHRHHAPTAGHKFSIGVADSRGLVGVCVVGRPLSRMLDDGLTAEVLRLCTDGTKNACSMLYGAAARAAKAMGYTSIITYTLAIEAGSSLKASGWRNERLTRGGKWDRTNRTRSRSLNEGPKKRWRKDLK